MRATPFRFGPEPDGIRHTLVLEVPLAGLTFEGDERGENDRVHLGARVRPSTSACVHRGPRRTS